MSEQGLITIDGVDLDMKHTPIVETPTVDKIMSRFTTQWNVTADLCIKRAEELESAAQDLRNRATELYRAQELSGEVKQVVVYEIAARNRALSLALVNPDKE